MKQGVVVFLDILGFKGIWQRGNADNVLELLNAVPELVKKTYQHPSPEKKWPESSTPQVTILSDTIVMTIDSDEPHCLLLAANILNRIIVYFHKNNIFIRGAIGYGKYSQSGNSFIGPAIDDVAEWHEKANLIGVISTPKTNYILDQFSTLKMGVNGYNVSSFIKYEVPCRNDDKYKLNCFNWPGFLQASFGETPPENRKSKARYAMENLFSKQDEFNGAVFLKYENTLKFIDEAVSYIEVTEK